MIPEESTASAAIAFQLACNVVVFAMVKLGFK